jgi:hypothetical protein
MGLVTLANRGWAIMLAANIPEEIRYHVYSEAFTVAALLDGLILVEINGVVAMTYESIGVVAKSQLCEAFTHMGQSWNGDDKVENDSKSEGSWSPVYVQMICIRSSGRYISDVGSRNRQGA